MLSANLALTAPAAIADSKKVKKSIVKISPVLSKGKVPVLAPITPASCPPPVLIDTSTASNGTTILKTVMGTRLVSSPYSLIAGTGNHTFAMNPLSSAGGKITFDTTTTQITIDSTTAVGIYLETITATASDTASVTTVINVMISVSTAVVIPVIDTGTSQVCNHIAHELSEGNERNESEESESHNVPLIPTSVNPARPLLASPRTGHSGHSDGERGSRR